LKKSLKLLFTAFLSLSMLLPLLLPFPVCAVSEPAVDISSIRLVEKSSGFPSLYALFDNVTTDGWRTQDTASITLTHEGGIGSLYLTFGSFSGMYTVTNNDTGVQYTAGEYGFIHEFLDLTQIFGTAPRSVTLFFDQGAVWLFELDVYSPGEVPDTVQKWEAPRENETDLVLFAAHGKDEHLYFAGLLPYYAVERGYQVQVVYLTDHLNSSRIRIHEILNGLWAAGIRTHPVFGPFPDFHEATTAEKAYAMFLQNGWSREAMTEFVVAQLRRFKPMVVVGHDPAGESGNGQHMVYSQLVTDALELAAEPTSFPESAEKYGTWDVPKTYLHSYKENPVTMNWDQPMENFGGMTPYQVSRTLGFAALKSQLKYWSWYFIGFDTAASITWHSPCNYGLYRSTVGEDVQKNDLFENVMSHTQQRQQEEQERLDAERLKAEEEARIAAEEQARREAEEASIAAEEVARKAEEAAQLAAEQKLAEEERLKEEQQAQLQESVKEKVVIGCLSGVAVVAVIAVISTLVRKLKSGKFAKKQKSKK